MRRGALLVLWALLVLPWIFPALGAAAAALGPTLQAFPPTPQHPLGTDALGRDVAARLLLASRSSLGFGALALAWMVLAALSATAVAGRSVHLERVLARVSDALLSVPAALWVIVAAAGGRLDWPGGAALVLGLSQWPEPYRQLLDTVRRTRQAGWVEAARGLGVGRVRLWLRHVLPALRARLVAVVGVHLTGFIAAEAGLSLLGLGPSPDEATLGTLLQAGLRELLQGDAWVHPWLWLPQTAALAALALVAGPPAAASSSAAGTSARLPT